MLADVPLSGDSGDRLGFAAYADALAGLLDHPDTDTPLTVSISAAWGSGKTSLANMITRRLVERPLQRGDRPHIICWFNAWLHDDAPHLGAAFAAEVAKTANRHRAWPRRLLSPLPTAMLAPDERWRRRVLLALASLAVAMLVALMPDVQDAVDPGGDVGEWIRAVAGERWAYLAVLGLAAVALWRRLFAVAQAAARFVDDPRSEAASGSMQQVREQLGKLIRQATRNPGRFGTWLERTWPAAARLVPRYRMQRRRLVLVVDDLERCRPPRAVEVCEVASQLLGHPDVATILVADMATVTASAEIKYAALETMPGPSGRGSPAQTLPTGSYGRRYLQKIVQLQFDLPQAGSEELRGLLTGVVDPRPEPEPHPTTAREDSASLGRVDAPQAAEDLAQDGGRVQAEAASPTGAILEVLVRHPNRAALLLAVASVALILLGDAPAWADAVTVTVLTGVLFALSRLIIYVAAARASQRRQQAAQRIDEEIKARAPAGGGDVDAVKAAVMESEAARKGGAPLAEQRFERFLVDDSVLRQQAESEILKYLPKAPRSAKRLVNHVRLLLVVASERRMLGGTPPLEAAHLGKWAVLLERWPELGRAVRAAPDFMTSLEREQSVVSLADVVHQVAPELTVSADLEAFLNDEPKLADIIERLVHSSPAVGTATR
jgi:hypothetical protein